MRLRVKVRFKSIYTYPPKTSAPAGVALAAACAAAGAEAARGAAARVEGASASACPEAHGALTLLGVVGGAGEAAAGALLEGDSPALNADCLGVVARRQGSAPAAVCAAKAV